MNGSDLLSVAKDFGPAGIFVVYLIWCESNNRKDRQAETESRINLATALEGLKNFIMGRRDV